MGEALGFRGLASAELATCTRAMLMSGTVPHLSDTPRVKVDEHSTGGVPDRLSSSLAPPAVACGMVVPRVSGRGLGHDGAPLDGIDAIPNFEADLPVVPHSQLDEGVARAREFINGL